MKKTIIQQLTAYSITLMAFLVSCNKQVKVGVSSTDPIPYPVSLSYPVVYKDVYSLANEKSDTIKYRGWYGLYEAWYNSDDANYTGVQDRAKGVIYFTGDSPKLTMGFDVYDEQEYYELGNHLERGFYNHFRQLDSSIDAVKCRPCDSIRFVTAAPELYNGINRVEVLRVTDFN